ncbi:MAG: oxygen-dependent coproporphyrinogen oxidase [Candidatus Marinimicrobia bacterium]|nr:oxygen-dependent coproporphyrinogen oxidase [Candidatus Neomarinimicrobiota bacterium]MCF7829446.1 oxygen-dependent coproporphyrinogen oxidase [Candidatus Neomarinimicrobiota bacterium]MCF7880932.1 oxygen-dependent coproporphyrinogen oxidase [Candidatus Neomarinimicrobiota bacterium]
MRDEIPTYLQTLQETITSRLEELDAGEQFQEDTWQHANGGGGRTRIMRNGSVFERAGVNFSEVYGESLPESIAEQFPEAAGHSFGATGISLVIHPLNPHMPTVHMNYRYFEAGPVWWFGGGMDLTPYYPYEEDVREFHRSLKAVCDRHDAKYYPKFKQWCDDYFYIEHREEPRGVGGIFFDYLRGDYAKISSFVRDCGDNFLPIYEPIVHRRKDMDWNENQRRFQLIRRGRYVEFNLVYDRGTKFGLQTKGRIESILISLPPLVRWDYDYTPEPGSREAELFEKFLVPQEWI